MSYNHANGSASPALGPYPATAFVGDHRDRSSYSDHAGPQSDMAPSHAVQAAHSRQNQKTNSPGHGIPGQPVVMIRQCTSSVQLPSSPAYAAPAELSLHPPAAGRVPQYRDRNAEHYRAEHGTGTLLQKRNSLSSSSNVVRQPPAQHRAPSIDFLPTLLRLADEFLSAARKAAVPADECTREKMVEQRCRLIAAGLACLRAVLKVR